MNIKQILFLSISLCSISHSHAMLQRMQNSYVRKVASQQAMKKCNDMQRKFYCSSRDGNSDEKLTLSDRIANGIFATTVGGFGGAYVGLWISLPITAYSNNPKDGITTMKIGAATGAIILGGAALLSIVT